MLKSTPSKKMLNCHCERSNRKGWDCFASLAMTGFGSFIFWNTLRGNFNLELAKIGQVQMRGKARVWGHLKAMDIVYRNGKWYASIVLEVDEILLKNNRNRTYALYKKIILCINVNTLFQAFGCHF
jgi:hypothetical protein